METKDKKKLTRTVESSPQKAPKPALKPALLRSEFPREATPLPIGKCVPQPGKFRKIPLVVVPKKGENE